MQGTSPRILPQPGDYPDHIRDAQAAFHVLKAGGVVILPTDVGYSIVSSSAEGIERAFAAKQRKPGHTLGLLGSYQLHRDLHILPEERFAMTRVITQDLGSLLAVIAEYKVDHPRLQQLSPQTRERLTKGSTLGIAILESPLFAELQRLNDRDGQLLVGSSANLTGRGQKFRVEDIEEEVRQAADLIIDYGLQRYYRFDRAGTIVDMENMRILRFGAAYELFRERMKKFFSVEFPAEDQTQA